MRNASYIDPRPQVLELSSNAEGVRRIQSGSRPTLNPAASIPAIATRSSSADEAPLTPTAPITYWFSSRTSTPPATGIKWPPAAAATLERNAGRSAFRLPTTPLDTPRSEEHTSELQSRGQLVCRLLREK